MPEPSASQECLLAAKEPDLRIEEAIQPIIYEHAESLMRAKSQASSQLSLPHGNGQGKKGLSLVRLLNAPRIEVCTTEPEQAQSEVRIVVKNDMDAIMFDASEEDTFTLDSFETLIHTYRPLSKAFLLARVITVDPSQPEHLYYSYYSAHHLNKVLFRTEPEKGLLHRMKSRNPLNNLVISGDVHYFAVQPDAVDRALVRFEAEMERRMIVKSFKDSNGPALIPIIRSQKHHRSTSDPTEYKVVRGNAKDLAGNVFQQSTQSLLEGSKVIPALPKDNSLVRPNIPIVYEAVYFASDEDFLRTKEVREYFRANSLRPEDHMLFPLFRNIHSGANNPPVYVIGPDGQPIRARTGPNTYDDQDEDGVQGTGRIPRTGRGWRNAFGLINLHPGLSISATRTGVIPMQSVFYLVFFYGLGAFVIINFLIPEEFLYLGIFFAILFFLLIFVFLVEWKPRDHTRRRRTRESSRQPQTGWRRLLFWRQRRNVTENNNPETREVERGNEDSVAS